MLYSTLYVARSTQKLKINLKRISELGRNYFAYSQILVRGMNEGVEESASEGIATVAESA